MSLKMYFTWLLCTISTCQRKAAPTLSGDEKAKVFSKNHVMLKIASMVEVHRF
jgi:hypothetical protein